MKNLQLPNGSRPWGAQMGRSNIFPNDIESPIKLRLERLRWVDGDYDQWGAYWGRTDTDVYCAWGEDHGVQVRVFVRATIRSDAKLGVQEILPNAKFYR